MGDVRERPILISGPMVRAILAGAKTQTRRVIKPQPNVATDLERFVDEAWQTGWIDVPCPHGAPGDRLWVRETFYCDDYRYPNVPEAERSDGAWRESLLYFRADVPSGEFADAGYWGEPGGRWTPSIHMPRWASRITLEVTSVRVERLHDITEEDARAEGVDPEPGMERWRNYVSEFEGVRTTCACARDSFFSLWESINGTASLAANPWVWVVGFRRVEVPRG